MSEKNTEPQTKEEVSKESKNLRSPVLIDTVILITLFTGFLYLGGLMQFYGYVSVWGVEAPLFPLSVNDYLVNGFFAFISFLGRWSTLFYALWVGGIVGILILIHQYLYRFNGMIILILTLCAFLLLTGFYLPKAYERGELFAQEKKKEFDIDATERKHRFYKEYRMQGGGDTVKGYLAVNNQQFLAVYSGGEVTVLPVCRLLSIKSKNLTQLDN